MVECTLCCSHFGSDGEDSEAWCFRGCGHVFCRGCIRRLRQIGCPTCRWKPPGPFSNNMAKAMVLKLYMDFGEEGNLHARLDEAEEHLAGVTKEAERLRLENDRLRKQRQEEADAFTARMAKATKDIEYLNRRLQDELTGRTKDVVAEAVQTTLQQYLGISQPSPGAPKIPPSKPPIIAAQGRAIPSWFQPESVKAVERLTASARLPSNPSSQPSQGSGNPYPRVWTTGFSGPLTPLGAYNPVRPRSPTLMDWSPTDDVPVSSASDGRVVQQRSR